MRPSRPAARALAALIAMVIVLGTGLAAFMFWLLMNMARFLPD